MIIHKPHIKIFLTVLFLFLSNLSFTDDAISKKRITIAGITNVTPVEYNTEKSGPAGTYVELWKLWSGKTGIAVDYIILEPDEAEKSLENGKIDVIMGYNSASASVKNFAIAYDIFFSDIYIYHNRKISSAEKLSELPPYRVGITSNTSSKLKNINYGIIFFIKKTISELIDASEKNEINIFIADSAAANHELKKNGLWRKFIQSSEPVFRHGIHAALKSDNKQLMLLVNSGFSRITETEKLVVGSTWAGGNFKYRIPWGFITALFVIAVIIAGVAAIWWWNYQLQNKIIQATKVLTILKDEAEAASIAKSRFLDNVSHKLRTPLTLIIAPIEDAVKGKPLVKKDLEMIHRNSLNLLSLINDLLDISRISAGRMNLSISETDLCAAVRLYCEEMESAADQRKLKLVYSLPDVPVPAYIDTKKFSRIISNLFSNSFKFTKSGGRITLSLEHNNEIITLKFSDTGIGIHPEKKDSIFNLFTQCNSENLKNYGGTGIGLAIVKDIAELHGGSASAESRHIDDNPEDHGTDIIVKIPSGMKHLADRDDVEFSNSTLGEFSLPFAKAVYTPRDEIITGKKYSFEDSIINDLPSILVVEDNIEMLHFIRQLLSGEYMIYTASNGKEALEILDEDYPIDLIISDVMMPEMDGHELINSIVSNDKFKGIPVLFLTAREDDFARHYALKLGAVDYITKPFNSNELKLRIKNQMEMRIMCNTLHRKNSELKSKLEHHMKSKKTSVSNDIKIKLEFICEFIDEHFTNELSRDNLASAADMNPDTFSRMFNLYIGKTLPDYINEQRIKESIRRIAETDDAITRICHDTGFDSIRTFNRVFRKSTGTSPGEFREKRNNPL